MLVCEVCGCMDCVRRFNDFKLCYTCRHIKSITNLTILKQTIRNVQTGESKKVKYTKISYILMMRDKREQWQNLEKLNV